ncbi:prealbumin-like fold domain-containing protein [Lacticaseibacillus absianus]|uniref:prealbumin-like fold domain-containing protein n=1 Tax=Lacticaseibacillus absianus TaxID=2729623 RepID=UPI0015CE1DD7|nr:prealbumin-like fold domain-containing protein [Lacticaseibacillus absianus]
MIKKTAGRLVRVAAVAVIALSSWPGARTAADGVGEIQTQTQTYYAEHPDAQYDVLGAAQRFHIFGQTVDLGVSEKGNIAAEHFTGTSDFGTAGSDVGVQADTDLNYLRDVTQISGSAFNSALATKFVTGTETAFTSEDNGNAVGLAGQKLALVPTSIYREAAGVQYIDFDAEYAKLAQVSALFAGKGQTVEKTTDNDLTINVRALRTASVRYPLRLTKVNDAGEPLAGATFKLVAADQSTAVATDELYDATDHHPQTNAFTTDAAGRIDLSVAQAGTYYFVETEAPSGYVQDATPQRVTTGQTPDAVYVRLSWQQLYGYGDEARSKINFTGFDFDDPAAAPLIVDVDFTGFDPSAVTALGNAGNITFDGLSAADTSDYAKAKILWNFYHYPTGTTIPIANDTFYGTILAPAANLDIESAHVYGSIIGRTVKITNSDNKRWDLNFKAYSGDNDITVVDHALPTTTVTAAKVWQPLVDVATAEGTATLALHQQDTASGTDTVVATRTLSGALNDPEAWTTTFTALPAVDAATGAPLTYTVRETAATVAGQPALTYQATQTAATVTNTQYGVTVAKYDADTGAELTAASGVTFNVTTCDADWQPTGATQTLTPAQVAALAPGHYRLREATPPTDYQLDDAPQWVTLTAKGQWLARDGQALGTQAPMASGRPVDGLYVDAARPQLLHWVKVDRRTLSLTLIKRDKQTHATLRGATFTLTPQAAAASDLTTAADGQVATDLSPTTRYVLTETQAPAGHAALTGSATIQGTQVTLTGDFRGNVTVAVKGSALTLTIDDPPTGELPATGGTGIRGPVVLSSAAVAIALGLFGLAAAQRRRTQNTKEI